MVKLGVILSLFLLVGCVTKPVQNMRGSRVQTQLAAEDLIRMQFSYGQFDALLDKARDVGLLVVRPTMEEGLGRELSHSENEALARLFRDIMAEVYPEKMWIDALGKVYARFFTASEIEAILEFYKTPAGRRQLELSGSLSKEGEAAGIRLVETKQDIFSKRFLEEITEKLPSLVSALNERQEDSQTLNVSETITACKKIEESQNLPIGCKFNYVKGRPSIVVTFQNLSAAESYWDAMSEHVAGPFCRGANIANRQAVVFINLYDSEAARIFSCEKDEWSEWFSYKEEKESF